MKFCFQNSEKDREDKNGRRLLLVSKMYKSSILAKYIGNLFSLSKLKVVYLHSFLSSLPFHKFCKKNFMCFGRKQVETEANFSQTQKQLLVSKKHFFDIR